MPYYTYQPPGAMTIPLKASVIPSPSLTALILGPFAHGYYHFQVPPPIPIAYPL